MMVNNDESDRHQINKVTTSVTSDTDDISYQLPTEVIIHIMSYLSVADKMSAGLVCHQWHEASLSTKFIDKQALVINREKDNLQIVMNTLSLSQRYFYHFIFEEVEVKRSLPIWDKFGETMKSLIMVCCDLSERTLVNILKYCKNLQTLHINDCRECFMSGLLLDDNNDVKELSENFQGLIELSLASNRYLSDALFNRFVSICSNIQSLSLMDCQISFHYGLYKKFYPDKNSLDDQQQPQQPSESVLTFLNILKYIKTQSKKIKHLNFGCTLIDNSALDTLLSVDDLKLETLRLRSCDQLTYTGLRSLAYQTTLKVLDISSCTRVTDASLLCICENLENIESLNIRRCRAVTDHGISQIKRLKKLVELDISACDQLTGCSITQGLCQVETINKEETTSNHEDKKQETTNEQIINLNLRVFNANALNLDDKSVECIANCFPNLLHLNLGHCFIAVTDKTIQKIFEKLILLRTLKIARCDKVSDAGITGMGAKNRENNSTIKLDKITPDYKLRISLGSRVEKEIVRDANRKKEVMEMCEDINSLFDFDITPGFSLIRLKGLTELDLTGCNRVTDVSLKHAFTFPELKILDLSKCQQITHVGLDYLTQNNQAIEDLNLSQCHNVTDIGIQYVAQRLHRLKRLHFHSCSQLTDHSLDSIKLYCKSLKYLDARCCRGISLAGIESLNYLHVKYSE